MLAGALILILVCGHGAAASDTYKAAVVQGSFPNFTTTQALQVERFVQEAAAAQVQIVVFAESALGSDTALNHRSACEPLPNVSAAPVYLCSGSHDTPVASMMSCLAKKYQIVIVFCACDVQGDQHYNTQMAVSSDGRLLAKYHKMHLYDPSPGHGESTHASYPAAADPTFFDTPFGIRFGMHTCFDMAFGTPAAAMALDPLLGISDFVFPTGWVVASPPMLPANAVQQGWSRGVGVNLLAADSAHSWGSSGSGIYSEGRALVKRVTPFNSPDQGTMLLALVPVLRKASPNIQPIKPNWNYKTAPKAAPSAHVLRNAMATAMSKTASSTMTVTKLMPNLRSAAVSANTSDGFSCHLQYSLTTEPAAEQFALLALNGHWLEGVIRSRSCLLFRCRTDECSVDPLFTIASDLNSSTTFERLELQGDFYPGDLVLPMLALSGGDIVDDDGTMEFQGGNMIVTNLDKPLLNAMLYASLCAWHHQ